MKRQTCILVHRVAGKEKKEKEQNEDVWFWQYLSWYLMPLLERANGEWSQCQENASRQKELLRNQNKLQMHLDKRLGISPPTYQQSVTVFLLLHFSRVGPDLAWVWDTQAPTETWVFICKQSCILILHAPVLAQGAILGFPPNPGHTQMPGKTNENLAVPFSWAHLCL